MILDFQKLDAPQRYFQVIQTLIPRPVAWVLSENKAGDYNLAPFSYFTAVCAEPPIVMISVGMKGESEFKDTRRNIEARNRFVIHIADRPLLEAMNATSATLPAGESEVTQQGLQLADFGGFEVPRLKDAKIAYGCALYEMQEIGAGPQTLIFGEIEQLYIDESILEPREDGRIKVDAARLDPVARLGAGEYGFLTDITRLARPK